MATTQDVKERIPGLQFRVESSVRMRASADGKQRGQITLICEFEDVRLFDAAVDKLNGFKVFSELSEEVTDALGAALDSTDQQLQEALAANEALSSTIADKNREIERLRDLLAVIEDDIRDQVYEEERYKKLREAGGE